MTTRIALLCPKAATRSITPQKPIHILHLPPTCSTTSSHFHLPPHYETQALTVNISLSTANLNIINISSLNFHNWQHLEDHWKETQPHHLAKMPSVPIAQLYKQMISSNKPITAFTSPNESIADTASIWTLFLHTGIYIMAIVLLIPAGLGIFCCYFFWCQPARLMHQPLQPGSVQYSIVDDDVEAAPIYRCDSKARQPTVRPCENHDLCIEQEPTQTELTEATDTGKWSSCIQIIGYNIPNPGNTITAHIICCKT